MAEGDKREVRFQMPQNEPFRLTVTDIDGKQWDLRMQLVVFGVTQVEGVIGQDGKSPLFEMRSAMAVDVQESPVHKH